MYGQNGHSSYSKAVDSAHSSVRVSRVSSTNDGLVKAIAPAYHAPIAAYHAPIAAYHAPAAYASPYHYGGHYAAPAVGVAAPYGHGYPYAGELCEKIVSFLRYQYLLHVQVNSYVYVKRVFRIFSHVYIHNMKTRRIELLYIVYEINLTS